MTTEIQLTPDVETYKRLLTGIGIDLSEAARDIVREAVLQAAKACLTCERAGLPRIRIHDLRHTCATLLLTQNVNPKKGQELLGHANIAETMDTYSHVLPNMQDEVAAEMESALA